MSATVSAPSAKGLLIKSPAARAGYTEIASPRTSSLRWITFGRLILNADQRKYQSETAADELVIDIFSGTCQVTVNGPAGTQTHTAGGRADAFAGSPAMVFVPAGYTYTVECPAGEAELALFAAPATRHNKPVLVKPEETMVKEIGRDNWSRRVMTSIGDNVAADRLILGETLNPPGNWSSAPPHKHDVSRPPREAVMEEVYYFQLKPRQGFGFMRVYSAPDDPRGPLDDAYVVEHGDTVLIPRGYHPVVAGPGYQLHYTWALAGEERRYGAWSDDPNHAWVKG